MELSHYLFSFFISFFIVLFFRRVDKKRSGLLSIKRFIDTQKDNFRKIIEEKKQEFFKASAETELLLNKGNALSTHINNYLKDIDKKLTELEKAEKNVETLKEKLDKLNLHTQEMSQDIISLKKEKEIIKTAKIDLAELTKNYKEISKKAHDFDKTLQDEMEENRILLNKKMQDNLKKFENFLRTSLEEISKENSKQVNITINGYQKAFRSWFVDKQKEMEEMNEELTQTQTQLEKVKNNTLTQIQKEVKDKVEDIVEQIEVAQEKINKQNEGTTQFKIQVYNEFNQKFREFQNETETVLNLAKHQTQLFNDELKKSSHEFKREMDNQVRDVSLKISGFEESLKQIDKIAQDHENRMGREVEARASEIEQNMKYRFDAIQNKILETEESVKDVVKTFQQKIGEEMQQTQHQIEIQKSRIGSTQKEMENKVQSFVSATESTVQSRLKEFNDIYDKGKTDIDQKINALTLDITRLSSNFKNEMKEEIDTFKTNLEKERKGALENVQYSIAKIDKDLNQHSISTAEKILSFESNLQKIDKMTREYEEKIHKEIDSKLKEQEENRLEILKNNMETTRLKLDAELKKQDNQLQNTIEDLRSRFSHQIEEIELHFKEKEKLFLSSIEEKSNIMATNIGELEEKLRLINQVLQREVNKGAKDIRQEMDKMEKTFEDLLKTSGETIKSEVHSLKDEFHKIKEKTQETQKNVQKEIETKIKTYNQEFTQAVIQMEKDLIAKKSGLESSFDNKAQNISLKVDEFQKSMIDTKVQSEIFIKESLDLMKEQVLDIEQKLNSFKSDKKIDRIIEEVANLDSMFKRLKNEKEFVSDAERNFIKLKKDSESLLNELGKFEAKKNEVANLNDRMNDIVLKSKEAEDRVFSLTRNITNLSQVETKIDKIQGLYQELQAKAEIVESKEIKIKELVQTIESSSHYANELREDNSKLKLEVDNIFKKNDFLTNNIKDLQMRLEDVKKGEEKIDHVLSRFHEIEVLSDDLEARLKKMDYATNKLDAAEARIKSLLDIVENPDTLNKAKKAKEKGRVMPATGVRSSFYTNSYQQAPYNLEEMVRNIPQSKKDSIIRFKNTGHKPEVIANILEMRPEEVNAVIKHHSLK